MIRSIKQRMIRAFAPRVRKCAPARKSSRANAGFTLTEALATVIIIGLVTVVMAGGISLASNQFTQSIAHSQAQQLYFSLAQTLDNDLRYTTKFYGSKKNPGNNDGQYYVTGYESIAHGMSEENKDIPITERQLYLKTLSSSSDIQSCDEPGELALCNESKDHQIKNRLVGKGSYNNGLKASIESFTYDSNAQLFAIELVISRQNGDTSTELLRKTFTVKALNNPSLN